MSQIEVILKASKIKMSSYTDPAYYCAEYKAAYNKAIGMIIQPDNGEPEFSTKATEFLLQAVMLRNTTQAYEPLVSQIQKNWKVGTTILPGNTDLTKTCNNITKYKVPHQSGKALITATSGKSPKESCNNKKCVKINRTAHMPDQCWKKYPHLRPKVSLDKMKTKGTRKPGNAATFTPPIPAATTSTPTEPPNTATL